MAQTGNQELTERFIQFYRNYYREAVGRLAQEYPNERRSLYIDYNDLFKYDRDLAEDFLSKPTQMREFAEEALRLYDLPVDVGLGQAHVRLENLPQEQTVSIRGLRVHDDHIGSLISVSGIVRKATDVRPKIVEAAFECQRCGTMSYIPQSSSGFQEPHECQGCERQGPFEINHDQSEFVDSQKLQIQESPEGLRGGETPQSIDLEAEDDITGAVTPGDHVTVVGVLHIDQIVQGQNKTELFDPYLEGVSIKIEDEEFEKMEITEEDIVAITELSQNPEIYDKMADSVAPAIYGYEEEKLAMVLQLFSGVSKDLPDGSSIRGDLHILLIGDPGTGKSQMISYVEQIAPRSVYTSGKGSSSAGLTAAAVQSDFGDGQQWTLEAGALVLADKGIAAVDELDKMNPDDRSAMHEALEQQKISVSKAGINATLRSRCSLLGAANPKYGRFDQYEPIGEQIDLEPALISRFDLIFTVTDQPDPDHDSRLADHILTTNFAGEMFTQKSKTTNSEFTDEEVNSVTEEVDPDIDPETLRKYIAYAKRRCFPTMSEEARGAIEEFYVDLRSEGVDEDAPIPITARKLEAMVRLAEASARIRLSDTVDEQDAERAVEITRSSLQDIGVDPETGEFDADVVETGTSKSQRDRIRVVKEIIQELQKEYEDGAPIETVIETAEEEYGVDEPSVHDQIDMLKKKGDVYQPRNDTLRVT